MKSLDIDAPGLKPTEMTKAFQDTRGTLPARQVEVLAAADTLAKGLLTIPHHHTSQPGLEQSNVLQCVTGNHYVGVNPLQPVERATERGPLVHAGRKHVQVDPSRRDQIDIQITQRSGGPVDRFVHASVADPVGDAACS